MTPAETSCLVDRIERLERRNRLLSFSLVVLSLLALAGWQSPGADVLRARRLEIVDERGVPLVVLSPDRMNQGGMVTLRDRDGEKEAWWQAGVGTSSLTLNSVGEGNSGGDSTLGLSVSPKASALALLSRGGASLTVRMKADQPSVQLYDVQGRTLFTAPWTK